jgi:phospholipase A1
VREPAAGRAASVALGLSLGLCLPLAVMAQGGPAADSSALQHCAQIGAAADRLACYDQLAGRAVESPSPAVSAPVSQLAPVQAPAAAAALPAAERSLLSQYWELDPEDKRGTFLFIGYKPNYVLPVHVTSRINRSPQSPTQAVVSLPNYREVEAKFQLSLRTKIAQDVLLPGGDLWLGFTQQAMWQIWNGKDSKPFRNSDYEPEAMYVLPTSPQWRPLPWDWQWRYTLLGIAHQSNGQSDPLSRSWNRLFLGAGFERAPWTVSLRLLRRLGEPLATDNNPDLVDYRGRAEVQLNWASGPSTASLLYRSTLKDVRYGALQLEWTYPIYRDQPNGLRWYLQAFRGYGETLTDYNFRQTSFGAGVTFLQF